MDTIRDSQKGRAQAATDRARAEIASLLYGDFESAQLFVDRVTKSKWFRHRYPGIADLGAVLKPLETNANASETGWSWERIALHRARFKTCLFPVLVMPLRALDQLTILHVIAHACATKYHDREWARAFLQLTAKFIGRPAATCLRATFDICGVRYRRAPKYSDEQLAVLRERGKRLAETRREKTDSETGAGGA